MEKISQITTGKAKSLYTTNEQDQLIMEFRDDTSAFDGKKIDQGQFQSMYDMWAVQRLSLTLGSCI
jgi:phosphoribosylaminoimidazole-succinocarboxamide synthase